MDAKEIREFGAREDQEPHVCAAVFLREIAAQLAELNAKLPGVLSHDDRLRIEVKGWSE